MGRAIQGVPRNVPRASIEREEQKKSEPCFSAVATLEAASLYNSFPVSLFSNNNFRTGYDEHFVDVSPYYAQCFRDVAKIQFPGGFTKPCRRKSLRDDSLPFRTVTCIAT